MAPPTPPDRAGPGDGSPAAAGGSRGRSRIRARLAMGARAVGGVLVFLASIRLLGEAGGAASRNLAGVFASIAEGHLSILGVGWLSTYLLTNGSVVAALGVTLAGTGAIPEDHVLPVVAGSRLGAAAFVLLVGGLYHLRRRQSLRSDLSLGVLTFLISHAVFIPAMLGSYLLLGLPGTGWGRLLGGFQREALRPGLVDAAASSVVTLMTPLWTALAGIVGLFVGVTLFDHALQSVELETLKDRIPTHRPWITFFAGLLVTGVASSVSFSIGVLVPAFNRGAITREEITPYVLGANAATLLDTLLVSIFLGVRPAVASVLTLMVMALLTSLVLMSVFSRFFGLLDSVLHTITNDRVAFAAFLVSLAGGPLLLVVFFP